MGLLNLLIEDYESKLDEEGTRYIHTIMENATKMDLLISDLLDLSRVSRAGMQKTKVDMKATALSMYQEVASDEEKKTFEVEIDQMPPVNCDSGLIKQVWQNLLSNALKYSAQSKIKKIRNWCKRKQ